jgi:hypothetical protein
MHLEEATSLIPTPDVPAPSILKFVMVTLFFELSEKQVIPAVGLNTVPMPDPITVIPLTGMSDVVIEYVASLSTTTFPKVELPITLFIS